MKFNCSVGRTYALNQRVVFAALTITIYSVVALVRSGDIDKHCMGVKATRNAFESEAFVRLNNRRSSLCFRVLETVVQMPLGCQLERTSEFCRLLWYQLPKSFETGVCGVLFLTVSKLGYHSFKEFLFLRSRAPVCCF